MSDEGQKDEGQKRELLRRLLAARAGVEGAPSEGGEPASGKELKPFDLSVGQKALWYLHQVAPESWSYNVVLALRIRSKLDTAALRSSLGRLVERHPSLRTRYEDGEGRPQQRILREGPELEIIEMTESSEDEVLARARAFCRRPFRLREEAPLRMALLQRSEEDQALVFVFHHIAVDFWSIGILVQELDRLYRSLAAGERLELPAASAGYGDFVKWQQELLAGPKGELLRGFWRRRLQGVEPTLELPVDRSRSQEPSFRGGTRRCDLAPQQVEELKALARRAGTTLFPVLLTLVGVLLGRLTGRSQVLIGTPVAGRGRAGFEQVVGYFVNLLPLALDLPGEKSLLAHLQRAGAEVLEALEHADLPFAEIVEASGARRESNRNPLCDVGFALESRKMDRMGIVPLILGEQGARTEVGGLACESLDLPQQEGQFELNYHFLETAEGIAGLAMYDADLLDGATVDRWTSHLRALVSAAVSQPKARFSELSLLTAGQRQQLLVEWQGRPAEESTETVVDLFRRQVQKTPEASALSHGGKSWSYRELDRSSDALGARLRALGAGPETIIGICSESSPLLVFGELATLKAGAAYLPLDPSHPGERLASMVRDARPMLVLSNDGPNESLVEAGARVIPLSWELASEGAFLGPIPPQALSADSLAYVIYTSGSTGRPKGVAVAHRGLPPLLRWHQRVVGVGAGDRLPNTSGPGFDPSGLEVWSALTAGATVLFPSQECRISGRRFGRWLAEEGVTVASAPTPLAEALLGEELPEGLALKSLFLGGDRLRRRPEPGCGFRMFNLYGPTEATIAVAGAQVRPGGEELPPPSLGHPVDGARIDLLDASGGPVAPGAVGEICLSGLGLARGYLGQPAKTAASFLPHPFLTEPGARLYRTGDLARRSADGRLHFVGRRDHQVKIRGVRIETGEVEAALNALPGIAAAVVEAKEAAVGGKILVAYVVPREKGLEESRIRQELEARLPGPLVPSAFVQLESLPLTPNGKVDRKALPEPGAAEQPQASGPRASADGLEEKISAVWCRVLKRDSVPPEVSFFDLGGHSLLLGELLVALEGELDRSLTAVELLRYPTVRSFARYLQPAAEGAAEESAQSTGRRSTYGESEPIAVIGMSGRFPGARSVSELWKLLREGREGLRRFSDDELEAAQGGVDAGASGFVPVGGDLEGVEDFDAGFFGLSPREVEILDPQQRFFLECCWEALEDGASVPGGSPSGTAERTGVFAGTARSSYWERHLAPREELVESIGDYQLSLSNDKDFLPTRVSYLLGLKGPSVNVQTACSTSLVAVHLACESLRRGECDQALAGGVAIRLPQRTGYRYQQGMILSPDGHCRPFDAQAAGTVGANGAGVVLLKPLARALEDGDPVRAVILGSAMNNDGSLKAGYTAPSVEGQAAVLRQAYEAAGIEPASIGYLEAHGTGTQLGDPIEVAALNEVFGGEGSSGPIALGSVKSNLGHLDAAAGVAGLIKAVLALEHGEIPPSLHFETPNAKLRLEDGPFRIAHGLQSFEGRQGKRRAAVSSFGIGGTNVHVVLEAAPENASSSSQPAEEPQLLVFSAASRASLEEAPKKLLQALRENQSLSLESAAATLQTGRKAFPRRAALVTGSREDALGALEDPARLLLGKGEKEPSVAFLFPGQGAQYPGMALGLAERFGVARRTMDRCADILIPEIEVDLRTLLAQEGEMAAAQLRQTAFAQPALFTVEYTLARLLMALGVEPAGLLGHSIGEFVAACLAEVLTLEDALRLVAARGRIIQGLPAGSMLAVDLDEKALLERLPGDLSLAAVNGPGRCVVSGPAGSIEAFVAQLTKGQQTGEGVQHRRLHTSHAFHSAMMEPAFDDFRKVLGEVKLSPPQRPYVSNVTGTWIRPEEAADPEYWVRHLRGTVRFADGLRTLDSAGIDHFVETGPGKALATFTRATLPGSRPIQGMPHAKDRRSDQEIFLETLGRLWLSGARLDWRQLWNGELPARAGLPPYAFDRSRYWIEAPSMDRTSRSGSTAGRAERLPRERWAHRPAWVSAVPAHLEEKAGLEGPWLLLLDEDGLGQALASSLEAQGQTVFTVQAGGQEVSMDLDGIRLPAGDSKAWGELLGRLPEEPRRVVHLQAFGEATAEDPAQDLEAGYGSLCALLRALAEKGSSAGVDVVASEVQRVLPGDPVRPLRAALLGPVTVLPQERPQVRSRLIDLGPPRRGGQESITDLAEHLLHELSTTSSGLVAWRSGQRWRRRFEAIELPAPSSLPEEPAVLVTGGLGGVGLELARELAVLCRARLVLLGRRGLEDLEEPQRRHAEEAIREIEKAGGQALVVTADVTDRASLSRALQEAKDRFGEIQGVIHAAGAPGGSMLEVMDPQESRRVLAPKVEGSLLLAELLPPEGLELFLLCSSLSSVLGGPGQAAYAAANAVEEALAVVMDSPKVTAVAWDLWRGVGMAATHSASRELQDLQRQRKDLGMTAIEGRSLVGRLLGCGLPQVAVSTHDLQKRLEEPEMPGRGELGGDEKEAGASATTSRPRTPVASHDRPDLATPYVPPRRGVEGELAEIWGGLLGIRDVGAHDDFFELGGHSLLGTRVLGRVAERFGVELQLSTLFERPTVAELAAELGRQLPPSLVRALEAKGGAKPHWGELPEEPVEAATALFGEATEADAEIDLDALDEESVQALLESLEGVEERQV